MNLQKRCYTTALLMFLTMFITTATWCSAASFDEIISKHESLTDAQYSEYEKSIIGEKVTWEGIVYNVTKNWLDENYEVKIDMDSDDSFDVVFDIDKGNALKLNKGSVAVFSGNIADIINVFGVTVIRLNDVRIAGAETQKL